MDALLLGWRVRMDQNTRIYYSHYDRSTQKSKLLQLHLREVAEAASNSVPPFLHFDVLNAKQLRSLLELQGYFHDLGKYTDFFQDYLVHDQPSEYKNHAHISAVLLARYLQEKAVDIGFENKLKNIISFLFYVMARYHHNDLTLKGLFDYEDSIGRKKILRKQRENLQQIEDILADVYTLSPGVVKHILTDAENILEDKKFIGSIQRLRMYYTHECWYFLMLYCFSQLVDKDKASAADLELRSRVLLKPEYVTTYIKEKSKNQTSSSMNTSRDQARLTVLQQIGRLSEEEIRSKRIFTLTAPTGIGKTLTSMQAAFLLSERMHEIYQYTPRIIATIPYINIIEQTKIDYAKVLENRGILNIHHRLSDKRLVTGDGREEETSLEKAMLEVESWEGDVILTTSVQFFQSLFTGNNAKLKKINKLAGSIVIIDEVQSIPEKYMPLIGAVLIKLAEYFGTRFILMSATQPYILEMGQRLLEYSESLKFQPSEGKSNAETLGTLHLSDAVQLLPNFGEYYKLQNRTKLVSSLQQVMDTDSFVTFFEETWGNKSAVVVVNTIKRCIELYTAIKERFKSEEIKIYHLSTNLIPIERKRVISEVKQLLDASKTVIVVSTQTIEAGVDLDFDVGYRDLAPLESIIQTAGRVNRNANKKNKNGDAIICPVYVCQLERDHQYIYALHNLESTKKLLEAHQEIGESGYLQIIDTYYRQLAEHLSQESIDLWQEGIMNLDFDKVSKFRLIPDDQNVVEVFVEFDTEAEKLANAYEMIRKSDSDLDVTFLMEVTGEKINLDESDQIPVFQRKALISFLLSRMSEYMVQIRFQRYQKMKPLSFADKGGVEASFFYVPRDQVDEFYNIETGYGEIEEARMW